MEHPPHHVGDDVLDGVRAIALALPGATERRSVGHPTFGTTKLFCWVGGSERGTKPMVRHPRSILVMADQDAKAAIIDGGGFDPAYSGHAGWVGVDLDAVGWDVAAELIEESFRITAPARLVAELDAQRGDASS